LAQRTGRSERGATKTPDSSVHRLDLNMCLVSAGGALRRLDIFCRQHGPADKYS